MYRLRSIETERRNERHVSSVFIRAMRRLMSTCCIRMSRWRRCDRWCADHDNLDPLSVHNSTKTCTGGLRFPRCLQMCKENQPLLDVVTYTLCLKKVPTFKLSVTSSYLTDFEIFLHCWKAYKICCKTYNITNLTLGTLLHYLGKLTI